MFDVITFGTATRDVFLRSHSFKTVRDPKHLEKLGFPTGEAECLPLGSKIEVDELVSAIGGGAVNAATTFARQGLKTATVIKIGSDANGKAVLEDLKNERISALPVVDRNPGTAYSAILLSPAGERTILHFRGVADKIKTSDISPSLRTKALYVVPGKIPLPVVASLINNLRHHAEILAMNPSSHYLEMGIKKIKSILNQLDVVIMNREEAALLTGIPYHDENAIFKKFDELVRGIAVMTDGPKGALVSDGRRIYVSGIFKGKHVDRTGAGDAFGSGIVSALIHFKKVDGKWSDAAIREAIRLGTANATSVVEKVGAQAGILTRHGSMAPRFKSLKITVRPVAK